MNHLSSVTEKSFDYIFIGYKENKVAGRKIYLTSELYRILKGIMREEQIDKNQRIRIRFSPLVLENFGFQINTIRKDRDYNLLLKELMSSGKVLMSILYC